MQPPRTEYVTRNVNVHEHRAPTDESVKLLREMEAKADAVKAVSVSNTTFECVVHQARDDLSDTMKWRAVFKLNGKPLTASITTNARDSSLYPTKHAKDAFVELRDEMAKVIATEVLNDANSLR